MLPHLSNTTRRTVLPVISHYKKAETLICERYADNCETTTPVRCCRAAIVLVPPPAKLAETTIDNRTWNEHKWIFYPGYGERMLNGLHYR